MSKKLLILPVLAVLMFALSCSEERGQVILTVASINPSSDPFGDIMDKDGIIPPDTVDIELHNDLKNPEGLGSLTFADIVVEAVTISFTRVDGGSDKPPTFRTATSYLVPAQGILTINDFLIIPATLKAQFPLSDLLYYGFERSTNFTSIRMDVRLEFTGHTHEGDPVYASGTITMEFTNWAD